MSELLPFPDPWHDWPEGNPYLEMSPVPEDPDTESNGGLSVNATSEAVYEILMDLMEEDLVDDRVQAAYNQLEVIDRRLVVDAWFYDAATRAELAARWEQIARNAAETQVPLHEILPFQWNA